ncbi:hypothetical protein CBM2609_B30267 [Cupriavidus taiwanensis]|uniref:hypothetical protein n=1 Tax=Cupriavidus taiwanensis TaxID=164546 RepID=UPI000E17ECFE|nr:hypothetical protein [Cupriavidus taiwanensis]SOZ19391.1 hypothetical protein CBM2604_B40266 [Cupriavidus taiwanensis]SOZ32587.1 hypothetical protein CBM2609_B30267 [Cupriavidus taiwanensis]SOZ48185.1 hypothetical protein CBM2610_B30266 [Cupriavidus taiwanensis]
MHARALFLYGGPGGAAVRLAGLRQPLAPFDLVLHAALRLFIILVKILALLVSDTFQPAPADSAAASSRRAIPQVQVRVRTDPSRHEAQDLQSLALHKEAIRLIQDDPALLDRAREVLRRWRAQGDSRSDSLWAEWETILAKQSWRKALGRTRRAQELRQASPLPTLLPDAVRHQVLAQIQALKKGVVLGDQE